MNAANPEPPTPGGILPRFRATLLARAVGGAAGLAASFVLARGLGASAYGDYSFLIASFASLNTLLDMGSGTAYYTFLSQGRAPNRHFQAFSVWLVLRFVLVVALMFLLPPAWFSKIWMGHPRILVLLAFTAFFSSVPLGNFLVQTAESFRMTVFIQTAQALLATVYVALLAILLALRQLSLPLAFALLIARYAIMYACFRWRFDELLFRADKGNSPLRDLARQYAAYCAPLVVACCVNYPCEFADRWLLQYFGGSVQQGLFSLSQQFASVLLLATASLLNIFWKEIAEAQHLGDRERVRSLYRRSSRSLFFLAAATAGFLMPHSRFLLRALAGHGYEAAWPALSFMFLYPVFQTLGQLNGVFLYATGDSKTQAMIGTVGLLLGLPLAYFALASPTALVPGLGLGSLGLAARWSLLQMAVVSVQCRIVARRQDAPGDVPHHFAVLGGLLTLGWVVSGLAAALAAETSHPGAAGLILSALFFWPPVYAWTLRFPDHAGLNRSQLRLWAFLRPPNPHE